MLQHGIPPLLIAAGCGNIQIIEVLMRKGAEIQAGDKVKSVGCDLCDSAVETGIWAAVMKKVECIFAQPDRAQKELLFFFFLNLQSGANAIYYAARHGHVETLKFLHEKKCPLDIQDKVNQVKNLCVFTPYKLAHMYKSTHT